MRPRANDVRVKCRHNGTLGINGTKYIFVYSLFFLLLEITLHLKLEFDYITFKLSIIKATHVLLLTSHVSPGFAFLKNCRSNKWENGPWPTH